MSVIDTFINMGPLAFGLITGAIVGIFLLVSGIFRKSWRNKSWAAIGLIGTGVCLSLQGAFSGTVGGIMTFDTMGRMGGSDPGQFMDNMKLLDTTFYSYQALAGLHIILGILLVILALHKKSKTTTAT